MRCKEIRVFSVFEKIFKGKGKKLKYPTDIKVSNPALCAHKRNFAWKRFFEKSLFDYNVWIANEKSLGQFHNYFDVFFVVIKKC